jgi:hypothetical protein
MTTAQREPRHKLIERLHDSREAHLARGRLYRIGFAAVGATVTLAGLAMLVLPGPALAVIPIGLFMLAMEFTWAERLLERAVDRAEAARQTARETTRAQRILAGVATALAAAAALAAALVWDIPVLPV